VVIFWAEYSRIIIALSEDSVKSDKGSSLGIWIVTLPVVAILLAGGSVVVAMSTAGAN